jgi:uncharacterized protein (TIGR03382 family)
MLWAWTVASGWCVDLHVGPTRPYPTLGEAVAAANAGDRILVDGGVYTEDINIQNVVDVEIVGSGSDPATGTVFGGGSGSTQWLVRSSTLVLSDLVIDGGNARRALTIEVNSDVEISNLRMRYGAQATGAGISVSASDLSLRDSFVEDNVATVAGGGLHVINDATVIVDGTTFSGNRTNGDGGAAWIGAFGDLTVRRSVFADNLAELGAGITCSTAERCTVEDSTFERNLANSGGGGLYAFYVDDLTVLRSAFCGNRAAATSGGGMMLVDGAAVVRNSTFLADDAILNGGGVAIVGADLTLENNTFVGSHAGRRGGAVFQEGAAATTSANNLYVDDLADEAPFAAVDMIGGTRTGGWDMYFDNDSDVFPERLPNDWSDLDPLLTLSGACEAPEPDLAGPSIDRGSPDILDPDGTRSDLGATGGPNALRDRDGDGVFDGEDCDDADPARAEDCDSGPCDTAVESCGPDDPTPADERPSADGASGNVGCGCGSGPSPTVPALLLALVALRRRYSGSTQTFPPTFRA